jgi:hypothetical protein
MRMRSPTLILFDIAVDGESGITEVHIDAATGRVLAMEHERGP